MVPRWLRVTHLSLVPNTVKNRCYCHWQVLKVDMYTHWYSILCKSVKILGRKQPLAPDQQLLDSRDALAISSKQTLSLRASETALGSATPSVLSSPEMPQNNGSKIAPGCPGSWKRSASARAISNHLYQTFCYCRPLWTLDDLSAISANSKV